MISFAVTRSDAHIKPTKQQTGGALTLTNTFRMGDIIEGSEGSLVAPLLTRVILKMKSFFHDILAT
jgi:hypothetical protein